MGLPPPSVDSWGQPFVQPSRQPASQPAAPAPPLAFRHSQTSHSCLYGASSLSDPRRPYVLTDHHLPQTLMIIQTMPLRPSQTVHNGPHRPSLPFRFPQTLHSCTYRPPIRPPCTCLDLEIVMLSAPCMSPPACTDHGPLALTPS